MSEEQWSGLIRFDINIQLKCLSRREYNVFASVHPFWKLFAKLLFTEFRFCLPLRSIVCNVYVWFSPYTKSESETDNYNNRNSFLIYKQAAGSCLRILKLTPYAAAADLILETMQKQTPTQ